MKRVYFRHRWLPYALLLPQLVITIIFFIWPASQALYTSVLREDAWGLKQEFVGMTNFTELFGDPHYLASFEITIIFSVSVAALAMGASLILAINADRVIRGSSAYKSLLIWPYAVAPALAGVLWYFMFYPTIGIGAWVLRGLGYDWNHTISGTDAMILVIVAAAWKQVSYNFLFFLAGLSAIPKSLIEAAAIDGAGPIRRFVSIIFPLLSPTTFFLLVVNVVYAFFETFATIHATTSGGPAGATSILVFKVYKDGFVGLDLGGSAAQSVVLMIIVIAITVIQFRFIERRVQY